MVEIVKKTASGIGTGTETENANANESVTGTEIVIVAAETTTDQKPTAMSPLPALAPLAETVRKSASAIVHVREAATPGRTATSFELRHGYLVARNSTKGHSSTETGWLVCSFEVTKASQGCIMVGVQGFSFFARFVALHDTPDTGSIFKKESLRSLICLSCLSCLVPLSFATSISPRARHIACKFCCVIVVAQHSIPCRSLCSASITS